MTQHSTGLTPAQNSSSRPVLLTFSALAGLQVLTGGAALADILGPKTFGLIVLLVAAVQAGMSYYVHNQVTPWKDVAAKKTPEGVVVAGPAAEAVPGTAVTVVGGVQ